MSSKVAWPLIMLLCLSVIVAGCVPAAPNIQEGTESPNSKIPSTEKPGPLGDEPNKGSSPDTPVASSARGELVTFTIWGVTPDLMYLVPLTVEADHPEDRPYQSIPLLTAWPDKSGATVSPWPEGTKIKLVSIKDGTATVDITNLDTTVFGSSREGFALDSIVYTLTQFIDPGIKRVQVLVNGKTQETLAGHVDISRPLQPGSHVNWISWSDTEQPSPEKAVALTLYFAEPSSMYLVPVTRLVPKTQAVARAVVEELIRGPEKESGLSPVLPAGTRCLGVKLDKGTLTVDFSRELRDNHSGGSTGEALTISGIVHSLTALPGVEQVQILIEGKTGESIGGHVVLSEPLRAQYLNLLPEF